MYSTALHRLFSPTPYTPVRLPTASAAAAQQAAPLKIKNFKMEISTKANRYRNRLEKMSIELTVEIFVILTSCSQRRRGPRKLHLC